MFLQRDCRVTFKILRQEMIVDNIHQHTAVFIKILTETVFAGEVYRVHIREGVDLAVQHDPFHNAGGQTAEIVAMHGVGNKIPDNKLVVAER